MKKVHFQCLEIIVQRTKANTNSLSPNLEKITPHMPIYSTKIVTYDHACLQRFGTSNNCLNYKLGGVEWESFIITLGNICPVYCNNSEAY